MERTVLLKTVDGLFTDELFFEFCRANDTLDFERDSKGNIILMAPTGSETGNYNFEIATEVNFWNRKHRLGVGFDSSTGFTLPNSAIRSPDVGWMKKEKWQAIPKAQREKFAPICPDFVVEIRSKTDSLKELQEKMKEWIENGCQLAWLIDRQGENVYIYRKNGTISLVSFDTPLSGEDILPDFTLNLRDIEASF